VIVGNPFVHAAWLIARRRLIRARWVAFALIVAAAVLLWIIGSSFAEGRASRLLTVIDEYRWVFAVFAFLHALFLISREQRQRREDWKQSWLVAAPLSVSKVETWLMLRAFAIGFLHLFVAVGVVLLLAFAARRFDETAGICGVLAAAFALGALAGCFLRREAKALREDSRYAPAVRAPEGVSAEALSRWPIAQALSWQRPENARVTLIIALFAVQGGSSMLVGFAVVSSWLLGIYLVTLMQATLHVSRAAAQWLRATPVRFAAFAWPLGKRVLVHQIIGGGTAAALAMAMGLPVITALYLLVLWLVIVIFILCMSLADAFCVRHSGAKLALMLLASVGIELRHHGWALPGLLMIGAWHVRRATSR
jgi:hypothetical protein